MFVVLPLTSSDFVFFLNMITFAPIMLMRILSEEMSLFNNHDEVTNHDVNNWNGQII